MKKTMIIDTNVLIHAHDAILKLDDNDVVLPMTVIEELDGLKKGSGEVAYSARKALKLIDSLRKNGKPNGDDLSTGVHLPSPSKGTLRIVPDEDIAPCLRKDSPDNRIISLAFSIMKENQAKGIKTVIISKDAGLRIKAESLKLACEDYKHDKTNLYADYGNVLVGKEDNGHVNSMRYRLSGTDLFRYSAGNETVITRRTKVYGLGFMNTEQEVATDAMIADSTTAVALTGQAGSGKTILALNAGLYLFEKKKVDQIVVARPVVPMSKQDLGFLPGGIEEKLDPWTGPIMDCLSVLVTTNAQESKDKSKVKYESAKYLIESGIVCIEPLAYIRGRTFSRKFVLIDESQNLTPENILTISTRIGQDSRIVFTGDLSQIDANYIDAYSSGLAFFISRFINEPDFAYINLPRSVRSSFAQRAAELLQGKRE